jgi:hypothetical protein
MHTSVSAICYHIGRHASFKRLWLTLLLAAGIIAPLAQATPALAVLCRSDPVLVVNGAVVNVVSTLQTDPSTVRELDYQITVPSGALLGQITLTVGLGFPENVTYVFSPDLPWGSVQVSASVITADGVDPFPVSVKVSSLLAGSNTAGGTSDATTTVTLDHVLML